MEDEFQHEQRAEAMIAWQKEWPAFPGQRPCIHMAKDIHTLIFSQSLTEADLLCILSIQGYRTRAMDTTESQLIWLYCTGTRFKIFAIQ